VEHCCHVSNRDTLATHRPTKLFIFRFKNQKVLGSPHTFFFFLKLDLFFQCCRDLEPLLCVCRPHNGTDSPSAHPVSSPGLHFHPIPTQLPPRLAPLPDDAHPVALRLQHLFLPERKLVQWLFQ
jgi:hypothetical protein